MQATPRQIAQATGVRLVCGPTDACIEGVATDSRAVPAGGLFVAVVGERVDGNDYAAAALQAGAAAVACTRAPDAGLVALAQERGAALLAVDDGDAERFLLDLASWWRSRLNCLVVGVTGSSGKSTTKEMVAAVLAGAYRTHATRGNLNSLIGAPLTVLACPLDAQAMVVEMGMNHRHEIEAIARMARPHLGVVTNVGTAHIGILGSRDEIARAKAELVEALPATDPADPYPGCVFLWGEDDYTPWIAAAVAGPRGVAVRTFGTEPADDVCGAGLRALPDGRTRGICTVAPGVRGEGMSLDVACNVPGAHCALDALAAVAVGAWLGIPGELIERAVASVEPMPMRQQVAAAPGGFAVVDDSYNANPDSMRRAVDLLCATQVAAGVAVGRRVACLGDMGELGERGCELHAEMGAHVAASAVDVLVAVGPLSRGMADAARAAGMADDAVFTCDDADGAAVLLRRVLRAGDAVLIKASRSTGLDATVKAVMQPWE